MNHSVVHCCQPILRVLQALQGCGYPPVELLMRSRQMHPACTLCVRVCTGAVALRGNATVSMEDCTFSANMAYNSAGGAMYAIGNTRLLVNRSTFTSQIAA